VHLELHTGELSGGRGYPIDEQLVADIARRSHERPDNESDDARQRAAPVASARPPQAARTPRRPHARQHGEQDPVIRPQGGRATTGAIPGAKLVTCPGMGHDLSRPLWPTIIEEICQLVDRSPAPHNPATAEARFGSDRSRRSSDLLRACVGL
jgi:pimeloyl-ACP methyl ester carboxylesterase